MAAYTTRGDFIGAEIVAYHPQPPGFRRGAIVYFRKDDVVAIHPTDTSRSSCELRTGAQLLLDTPFPALFQEITGVEV